MISGVVVAATHTRCCAISDKPDRRGEKRKLRRALAKAELAQCCQLSWTPGAAGVGRASARWLEMSENARQTRLLR